MKRTSRRARNTQLSNDVRTHLEYNTFTVVLLKLPRDRLATNYYTLAKLNKLEDSMIEKEMENEFAACLENEYCAAQSLALLNHHLETLRLTCFKPDIDN